MLEQNAEQNTGGCGECDKEIKDLAEQNTEQNPATETLNQRTDEWHQARLGKVTASKIADIMAKTKSGYSASRANYMTDLIIERLTVALKNEGGATDTKELKSFIGRIERLEEQKTEIGKDITDVYNEARGHGFDPKVMREIVRLRKKNPTERDSFEALRDLYAQTLGLKP